MEREHLLIGAAGWWLEGNQSPEAQPGSFWLASGVNGGICGGAAIGLPMPNLDSRWIGALAVACFTETTSTLSNL